MRIYIFSLPLFFDSSFVKQHEDESLLYAYFRFTHWFERQIFFSLHVSYNIKMIVIKYAINIKWRKYFF